MTPRDTGWDGDGGTTSDGRARGGRHGRPDESAPTHPAARRGVPEEYPDRHDPRSAPRGRPVPEPRRQPTDTGEHRHLGDWDETATEHIPVVNDESRAGRRSGRRQSDGRPAPTGRMPAPPRPSAGPGVVPVDPGRAPGRGAVPVDPGRAPGRGAVPVDPGRAPARGAVPVDPGRAPAPPPGARAAAGSARVPVVPARAPVSRPSPSAGLSAPARPAPGPAAPDRGYTTDDLRADRTRRGRVPGGRTAPDDASSERGRRGMGGLGGVDRGVRDLADLDADDFGSGEHALIGAGPGLRHGRGAPEPTDLMSPEPGSESGLAGGPDSAGTGLPAGRRMDVVIDPLFSGTREIRTGRRAELRRQINEVRRLRTATVILLVLAVLGAPLGFYALREAARDPVFGDLAALEVPDWASRDPQDEATGSRWCIGQCRLRQRIMRSERPPEETSAAYTAALRKAGWTVWPVPGCPPEGQEGIESCWQRDEYVLDLYIYQPECEVQLKAPEPATAGTPPAPLAEAVCPPTVVTLKVINRVAYQGPVSGAP